MEARHFEPTVWVSSKPRIKNPQLSDLHHIAMANLGQIISY